MSGRIVHASYRYPRVAGNQRTDISLLGTALYYHGWTEQAGADFWPAQTELVAGQAFEATHGDMQYVRGSGGARIRHQSPIPATLHFDLEVDTRVFTTRVEWTPSCGVDKENAVMLREYCSQGAETRTVWDNGVAYPVYQDCWQTTQDWQLYESDDNSCGRWESDRNCTVGTRRCLQRVGDFAYANR